MSDQTKHKQPVWIWLVVAAIAVVATFFFVRPARSLGVRFFDSLRIPKPQAATVDIGAAGPNGNRSLQQLMIQMISSTASESTNESDQPAASPAPASGLAGFAAQLPATRKDSPRLIVGGAHAIHLNIDRPRLAMMLDEAGEKNVVLPQELDQAAIAITMPRSIQAQYGNCPAPANTIQAQLQGPPPPTTDNSDCLVLMETPEAAISTPKGLNLEQVVEIGLQLSGMSPNQTKNFLNAIGWKASLSVALPRFMRSYETVEVQGVQAALLNTVSRRGPTYELIWAKNGMVYSMTGYGSASDAVGLANSVH